MKFTDFSEVVESLKQLPNLKSLYTNLFDETEVDMIMQNLDELEFLNGLPVERVPMHSEDSLRTGSSFSSSRSDKNIQEIPEQDEESSGSDDIKRKVEQSSSSSSKSSDSSSQDDSESIFNESFIRGELRKTVAKTYNKAMPRRTIDQMPNTEFAAFEAPSGIIV
jgi:hypothetical protein